MGNCCATPVDYDSSKPLRNGEQSHKISGHGGSVEMKARSDSVVPDLDSANRPRVHRNRTPMRLDRSSAYGVEQRSVPLKDCSDEVRNYFPNLCPPP